MLDEMVNIADLLHKSGLATSSVGGLRAIGAGKVYIERWNIGLTENVLPRWVLRGVTIRCGDKSIRVSDDGYKLRRAATAEMV
jgi:hypothetical protein